MCLSPAIKKSKEMILLARTLINVRRDRGGNNWEGVWKGVSGERQCTIS